jgi:tetratricopeptide (TPR) repeat protein
VSDLYLYLAILYEDADKYDESIKVLDRALEKLPNDTELLFRKGIVMDKTGKKEEAVETMRKILSVEPKNANALNYIGYSYAEAGTNLTSAKEMIIEALASAPDDGYIMDSLAWVYFKMGQNKKALDTMLEAIKRVPDDPVIQEHLGDIYLELGKRVKATEAYEKAIQFNHSEPEKIKAKLQAIK